MRMQIVDRVAAGHDATHALGAGEAIRIFTGAPMPDGADTVFMQEDCRVEGSAVIVPPGLKRGANRRLAGEDIRAGTVALPAGRRLAVQHVALAAALGLTALNVRRRVRVALFSTGDEIVEPGTKLPRAALYDFKPLFAVRFDRPAGRRDNGPRHSQRRSERTGGGAQSRGGRSRSGADVGRCFGRRGGLRSQHDRKHRQDRVLARRDQAGASGGVGRHSGREAG